MKKASKDRANQTIKLREVIHFGESFWWGQVVREIARPSKKGITLYYAGEVPSGSPKQASLFRYAGEVLSYERQTEEVSLLVTIMLFEATLKALCRQGHFLRNDNQQRSSLLILLHSFQLICRLSCQATIGTASASVDLESFCLSFDWMNIHTKTWFQVHLTSSLVWQVKPGWFTKYHDFKGEY